MGVRISELPSVESLSLGGDEALVVQMAATDENINAETKQMSVSEFKKYVLSGVASGSGGVSILTELPEASEENRGAVVVCPNADKQDRIYICVFDGSSYYWYDMMSEPTDDSAVYVIEAENIFESNGSE